MSRIHLSLALITAACLIGSGAYAQVSPPAPKTATPPTSSQPSTASKVENWTMKQWNAAKMKWSKDKAKWNACNKEAKDQKLSGRKSWSYLNDCMNKA